MIFQWQLFVLLIAVAILTPILGQQFIVNSFGNREIRYKWLPVLVISIPMIYLAGTRVNYLLNFGDTSAYLSGFNDSPTSITAVLNSVTEDSKDVGFSVFTAVLKNIIGEREVIYFTIIAAICILCVMYTYKKYSCNFVISVFLFIASADYLQWTYNGIRQFIPVSILFACAGLIIKKKYVPLIIIILILSTIHASTLLMLPMIFIVQGKPWNKKTLLFALVVIIAIAFVDQFTDLITTFMENSQYSGEVDQYLNTEGTNALRVLVYSIPAILSLLFRKRIIQENNPIINIASNMALITALCYLLSAFTSGMFIGRIPIMFSLYSYILIPWIVEKVFTKRSAIVIYIFMIGFYLVYYYYQIHITWGL